MSIFACARRDRLLAQARAGDERALQVLLCLVPADLPPAVLRAERDREIAELFRSLVASLGWRARPAAELLARAGERIQQGRHIGGIEFSALTAEEAEALERRVVDILAWAQSWPRARQMRRIVGA